MKLYLLFLLTAVVLVDCGHRFLGTNVQRVQLYHRRAEYSATPFFKRIETVTYRIPDSSKYYGRSIQGILAYDMTYSDASANVTGGGLGYKYVNLRLKSARSKKLDFDIYIYA